MNYKKRKSHKRRILKSRAVKAKRPAGWSYSGRIAREVIYRREFKMEKIVEMTK